MGYELLEALTALLAGAGIRAGEEYPGERRMEILSPAAAVGLREVDPAKGTARFSVRILSPLLLGGWCCQTYAAKATQVLHEAGYTVQTGQMEVSGDCFCVLIEAELPVVPVDGNWVPGRQWQVTCGGAEQEGVTAFRAVLDLDRRVIGTLYEGAPAAVSAGKGCWEIELQQETAAEPEEPEEPFELLVSRNGERQRYSGCCWDRTEMVCDQSGVKRTRWGYALSREVLTDE